MNNETRVAGVLGGMGPEATVDFMRQVIALTKVSRDQDHVRMLVDHNPQVPSRQRALLEDGPSPAPELAAMAARLEAAGADFLVMPCNTAFAFRAAIEAAVRIPLLSIVELTAAEAIRHGARGIGILATRGCLRAGVYQEQFSGSGVALLLPGEDELDLFMELVERIKLGDTGGEVKASMMSLALAQVQRGARAIIVGCTEVPLVLDPLMIGVPLISSTEVLAAETVRLARGDKPLPHKEA
jgi:aspartate racemase